MEQVLSDLSSTAKGMLSTNAFAEVCRRNKLCRGCLFSMRARPAARPCSLRGVWCGLWGVGCVVCVCNTCVYSQSRSLINVPTMLRGGAGPDMGGGGANEVGGGATDGVATADEHQPHSGADVPVVIAVDGPAGGGLHPVPYKNNKQTSATYAYTQTPHTVSSAPHTPTPSTMQPTH